jgi:hypothetical protein
MRQYAVIVIGLLVLVGGLVARRYLDRAPMTAAPVTVARPEAQARALASGEALAAALTAGPQTPEALAPKIEAVKLDCAALESTGPAPACGRLRIAADGLAAAKDPAVEAASVRAVHDAVAALRAEARP